MCLTNTSNDSLARRSFRMTITLSSQNKQMTLTNSLMNYKCTEVYTIINEIIVFEVCKQLQIESYSLSKSKPLRDYNEQLTKKSITYCLLSTLNVHDYKKGLCSIFIAKIKQHNLILEKS